MRIGIHTSIAGSLERAALTAARLGANTFQIFSASPRMWSASPLDAGDIGRLRDARRRYHLRPLAIHANYLVNLAAAEPQLRARSVASFRGELERALAIGAEYLVAHPGNFKGHSIEQAIDTFARSLGEATKALDTTGVTLLIENTAGSGSALGSRLEELALLKRRASQSTGLAVGFCIDTCHLLASGYDIASPDGLRETVRLLDGVLGLANVPVFHANDSKTPLASRVDRHEHVGEGYIGKEGFRRILSHPQFRGKAFIAETPYVTEGDDLRNIQALKNLCRKPRTTTKKSN